jgi:hypothetical protein
MTEKVYLKRIFHVGTVPSLYRLLNKLSSFFTFQSDLAFALAHPALPNHCSAISMVSNE